jgi:hypothetical protein
MSRKYRKKHKRVDGFRSKLEHDVSPKLPKGTTFESEKLKYFIPKNYIPDFVVPTKSGRKIYLEVKGYLRYEDQQKMRAVKLCNSELDIRFFFPNNNRVHGSKMTNSEWCEKYGFKYCIGKIPRGWFK